MKKKKKKTKKEAIQKVASFVVSLSHTDVHKRMKMLSSPHPLTLSQCMKKGRPEGEVEAISPVANKGNNMFDG
ncbi:MAG: hypothetical protein ACM3X9_08820 [Bacillota bacterium]